MKLWKVAAAAAVVGVASGVATAGDEKMPERLSLLPGDAAPSFAPTHWVQGESVEGFDKGQVYVVDFWATWCGPCIAAMPHLTKVQKEHPESVTVIAMNVWEKDDMDLSERVDHVKAKVSGLGEKMDVRVAIDGERAMEKSWMRASASSGIPRTFIIDQGGRVAWIGHPMQMDEPLEEILDGSFNVNAFRAEYKEAMEPAARIADIWDLFKAGDYGAFQKAASKHYDLMKDDPGRLNALAWEVTTNQEIEHRDLELAHKAAKRACELTDWSDPSILDTYAHVLFAQGDTAGAVKIETKAIEKLPEGANGELARALKEALARFKGAGAT